MICKKKYFSFLIIYILFFQAVKSQELHLNIVGKDSLETAVVDSISYSKIHSSFNLLSREVDSMFQSLQKIGYVDALLFPLEKKNDSLYSSRIILGNQFRVLKLYYKKIALPPKLLKRISKEVGPDHFSVYFPNAESVLQLLNDEIANQGRPFNYFQLRNLKKGRGDTLVAELTSVGSEFRKIDEIIVKGYEKFPVSYLKYFLGMKKGRPFNKALLEEKMQRLKNLRFAESIKPPEIQFTRDSTTVYLYLEKERSNTFDGFLGFSNDSEKSNLRLTGHVDFLLLNNLNYGESLNVQYKSDGEEQVNFRANLDLPYLFGTPVGLSLGLEIFKKDSSYVTVEQQAKINYRFGPKINTYVGYRKMESNNLLENNFAGGIIEDYTSNYIDLGGTYLDYSRFSALFPINTSLGVNLGFGKRDRTGKSNRQFMGSIYGEHIFQFNRRNAIYLHNESALLSSEYPLANELFRLGGIHSVRGFAENSIFASLFSVTQTEYRYILSSNMYIHSIIDHAYYENKVLGLKENLYGIGVGFGLKSGAGILKVNFANGKADGQNFEFSNSKIHLSLTTKF